MRQDISNLEHQVPALLAVCLQRLPDTMNNMQDEIRLRALRHIEKCYPSLAQCISFSAPAHAAMLFPDPSTG